MIDDEAIPAPWRHMTYVNSEHFYTDPNETIYVVVGQDGRFKAESNLAHDSPLTTFANEQLETEAAAEKCAIDWMTTHDLN